MQVKNESLINDRLLSHNMWLAKFKNWHLTCLLRPKCVELQVADFVYLINCWREGEKFCYTELHILQGKEENKKQFIQYLKTIPTITNVEVEGNYVITKNEEEQYSHDIYDAVFDPELIYVKPVLQRTDGYEEWEIASWNREKLMKILEVPSFKIELKSIQNVRIGDIFLPQFYPKLAPKQREAIELAVKEGYYEYPRGIDLEGLGRLAGVQRQTYQENLRRAERKIIPFITEQLR